MCLGECLLTFEVISLNIHLIVPGEVTAVLDGIDGEPGTQYSVDYRDEGNFEVDHLLEDYQKGDLKFL